MKVFVRADADSQIGNGHVMRCLTLADELKRNNAHIGFICREETGNLISLIENKKYPVYSLPSGIDRETDEKLTQDILKKQPGLVDWVIVDHYNLDASYESSLRSIVKHIMVIDDLANRLHDCDLLLDQNYHHTQDRYTDFVPDTCQCLCGLSYALLRLQFRVRRASLLRRHHKVRRLLVSMGGADPTNETCKVLRGIQLLQRPELSIDVVIGASNPHRQEIENFALRMPSGTCHMHVENMAELMAIADVGIGAAGTSTWERCCLGLPSIVMILADNQRDIAENLDKNGIVKNLGWYDTVTEVDIQQAIQDFIQHPNHRESMSIQSQAIVDGKGTARVVKSMMGVS